MPFLRPKDKELIRACRRGEVDRATDLLTRQGASPNCRDVVLRSPLYFCSLKGHLELLRLLLRHGALPSLADMDGYTPLHWAAAKGFLRCAEVLVKAGADVNVTTNKLGDSPLYWAMRGGNKDIVRLLLKNGADVTSTDTAGVTLVHAAADFKQKDSVAKLVSRGAEVDLQDKFKFSALHVASDNGSTDVVRALLNRGANPNAKNNNGDTPLHLASAKGHVAIATMLLDKGAAVNAQSKNLCTPLHYAAGNRRDTVLQLLLDRGGDPSIQSFHGQTVAQMGALGRRISVGVPTHSMAEAKGALAKVSKIFDFEELLRREQEDRDAEEREMRGGFTYAELTAVDSCAEITYGDMSTSVGKSLRAIRLEASRTRKPLLGLPGGDDSLAAIMEQVDDSNAGRVSGTGLGQGAGSGAGAGAATFDAAKFDTSGPAAPTPEVGDASRSRARVRRSPGRSPPGPSPIRWSAASGGRGGALAAAGADAAGTRSPATSSAAGVAGTPGSSVAPAGKGRRPAFGRRSRTSAAASAGASIMGGRRS